MLPVKGKPTLAYALSGAPLALLALSSGTLDRDDRRHVDRLLKRAPPTRPASISGRARRSSCPRHTTSGIRRWWADRSSSRAKSTPAYLLASGRRTGGRGPLSVSPS